MRANLTILLLALAATGEHRQGPVGGATLDWGLRPERAPSALYMSLGTSGAAVCLKALLLCSCHSPTAGAAADAASDSGSMAIAIAKAQAQAPAAGKNAFAQASVLASAAGPSTAPQAAVKLIIGYPALRQPTFPSELHCAAPTPTQPTAAATAIAGGFKPFPPPPPVKVPPPPVIKFKKPEKPLSPLVVVKKPEMPKVVPIEVTIVKPAAPKKKEEAPEVSSCRKVWPRVGCCL